LVINILSIHDARSEKHQVMNITVCIRKCMCSDLAAVT